MMDEEVRGLNLLPWVVIGVVLMIAGFTLMTLSLIDNISMEPIEGQGSVGIIVIGPIPIIFSVGDQRFIPLLMLSVMVVFLITLYIALKWFKAQSFER